MFTGIIQSTAKLKKIISKNNNYTYVLESNLKLDKKDIGTSISIDGVCLTLVSYKKISKKKIIYSLIYLLKRLKYLH